MCTMSSKDRTILIENRSVVVRGWGTGDAVTQV